MIFPVLRRVLACLTPAAAVVAHAAPPPNLPVGVQFVRTVEGITEYRLPNGLQGPALPRPRRSPPSRSTSPTSSAAATRTTARPAWRTCSSTCSSRARRSTRTSTRSSTSAACATTAPPGSTAPTTSRCSRRATTTSRWALELEADRMVNSFIAKKDLDSEMTVVRNEYESGENSPFSVMFKRLQSIAFDWHSYGRSTIGNRSDIENVRIENLQAFYRTYYQPDNAVLLVAGQVRRGEGARARRAGTSAASRSPSASCRRLDGRADAGRRARVRRAAQGRRPDRALSPTRCPRACTPTRDALGVRHLHPGQRAHGRLHKALVEKRQGGAGVRLRADRPRRRAADLRRGGEEGRRGRAGARRAHQDRRGLRPTSAADHGGDGARAPGLRRPPRRRRSPTTSRFGVADVRVHRAGRLAALLPRATRRCEKMTAEQVAAGREGVLPPRQPHRGLLPARGRPAARRDPARRRPWPR